MKIKFYRQQYTIQDIKDYIRKNDINNYTIFRKPVYYELEYKK